MVYYDKLLNRTYNDEEYKIVLNVREMKETIRVDLKNLTFKFLKYSTTKRWDAYEDEVDHLYWAEAGMTVKWARDLLWRSEISGWDFLSQNMDALTRIADVIGYPLNSKAIWEYIDYAYDHEHLLMRTPKKPKVKKSWWNPFSW